jgi:fucose 4-O-acetylase-like acetyltransferase
MPLFFFISGYLFHGETGFKEFFRRKARTLLIPYFCLGIPLLAALVIQHERYRSFDAMTGLFAEFIIQKRFQTIWFIACLFLLNMIFYFLNRYLPKKGLIIASALFLAVGILNIRFPGMILPWNLDACFMAMPFFSAGCLFRNRGLVDQLLNSGHKKICILALFALSLISTYLNNRYFTDLDMFADQYGFIPLSYSGAMCGILLVICVSERMTFEPVRSIGENSILYLAWHQAIILPLIGEWLDVTRYVSFPLLDRILAFDVLGLNLYKVYYTVLACILIRVCVLVIEKMKIGFVLGK